MVLSLLLTPELQGLKAHAAIDDMQAHHDKICKDVDSVDPSLGTDEKNLSVAKDECANSTSAIEVAKLSRTKAWIYGVLSTTCFTLAATSWMSAGTSEKICNVASAGIAAQTMLLNSKAKEKISARVKALQSTSDWDKAIGALGGLQALWAGKEIGKKVTEELVKKFPKTMSKKAVKGFAKHAGCIVSGILGAAEMGLAFADRHAANKSQEVFLDAASDKLTAFYSGNSIKKYVPGKGAGTTRPNNPVNSAAGNTPEGSDPCSGQGGNSYLSCVNQKNPDPQVSAILASPELLDVTEKMLGKPLGDALKEFHSGKLGDVEQALSSSLGLGAEGPGLFASLAKEGEKIAKELGLEGRGGAYLSQSRKKTEHKDEDLDFSKMMGNLLGQLNPDQKTRPQEDPSEAVFRKLDLLPAEKIEANKDISLFARIGYRYRKKTPAITEESNR